MPAASFRQSFSSQLSAIDGQLESAGQLYIFAIIAGSCFHISHCTGMIE